MAEPTSDASEPVANGSHKIFAPKRRKTGVLMMADGAILRGQGVGATGVAIGEVCFNTAITGYQEILTDPSYAGQIVAFTFPHIGNVGTNSDDFETTTPFVRGLVIRADITSPSNYRAMSHLDAWLKRHNLVGLCGVDTRALTKRIREAGMPNAAIAHDPSGEFDFADLETRAKEWPGLEGMDLAKDVTCGAPYEWTESVWAWPSGYMKSTPSAFHVVAVDFGVKRNILRLLASKGCRVTVVPANTTADKILNLKPDGIFLSNGPGDPAATGAYAAPEIRTLIESGKPIFGICLGHQILSLALGAKTKKMRQGHHGANHPVKDLDTSKVEIVSMNHGFTVDSDSLPDGVRQTHVSLFDGTNCGLEFVGRPVFSVQHHPEASPGPQDSYYLFDRFIELMQTN